ncbi:Uncharacterized conserved protein YlxW, UPF0749 family [Ruaniaceae bacterium KH17]|nr:Uncharacterized conserved protein YlxW, UPF0749 family [Ruaniaceae bacterium KH17]
MTERTDGPRESVSDSVLRDLFNNPIDQGYRPGLPVHDNEWWKRLLALVLVIVLTTGATWSAVALRHARTAAGSPTQELQAKVESRIETQGLLQSEVDRLQEQINVVHASVLPVDPDAVAATNQLRLASSTIPVSGPGITVSLDDSNATTANERLRDFDLQVITNALWESGAEAIDINGQRLSSNSAIRSAGSAILVNLTPLVPPYVISAIGDPHQLQVELARSRAASHLATLRDTFGVRVSIDTHDQLSLTAAREATLRFAEPVP